LCSKHRVCFESFITKRNINNIKALTVVRAFLIIAMAILKKFKPDFKTYNVFKNPQIDYPHS
jgi:hypothetical protein